MAKFSPARLVLLDIPVLLDDPVLVRELLGGSERLIPPTVLNTKLGGSSSCE